MSRLIDADALKHDIKVKRDYTDTTTAVGRGEYIAINKVLTMVDEQPTITPDMAQVLAYECGKNAVSVVQCKDCCYWDRETVRQNSNDVSWWNEAVCRKHSVDGNEPHEMWTDADWFCADGERGEAND